MTLVLLALMVATVASLAYVYMTRNFNYWKIRGVPFIPPTPFFGNIFSLATFKSSSNEAIQKIYSKIDAPFFGIFILDKPVLMIKCPKLLNSILITDSAQFTNRSTAFCEHDMISSNMLFFQKNSKWKKSRSKLLATFSPVKLKRMSLLVDSLSMKLIDELQNKDVADLTYISNICGTEMILNCFFGLTTNYLENRSSELWQNIKKQFAFTWRNVISQSSYFLKPEMVKFFQLSFLEKSAVDYLTDVLIETMKTREYSAERKNDLVDVLKAMEEDANKNGGNISTRDFQEILGGGFTFFFAGIHTLAGTLLFTLYELSLHQDIQDEVRNEIRTVIAEQGSINYETVGFLKLLDWCLCETMRKHPLIPYVCRRAENSYRLPDTNLTIEKGTPVFIPLSAIHMDEKYFVNPDTFDPYRFGKDFNTDGQICYSPFGHGPRKCIGDRYSMINIKIVLVHFLLNYKFEKAPTTPIKIEYETKNFFVKPKTNIEVKISKIMQSNVL